MRVLSSRFISGIFPFASLFLSFSAFSGLVASLIWNLLSEINRRNSKGPMPRTHGWLSQLAPFLAASNHQTSFALRINSHERSLSRSTYIFDDGQ
jgi:hypothetical protein